MNQFYPGVKNQLLAWALGEKPAGVELRVMAVDDTYVFNPADVLPQSGVLADNAVAGNLNNGIVSIGNYVLHDLPVGETLKGLIVYFKWPTGVKLICFIDSAADMSLPTLIEQSDLQIRWDAAGVFRI